MKGLRKQIRRRLRQKAAAMGWSDSFPQFSEESRMERAPSSSLEVSTLHCTTLLYIALHCTTLHYTTLHCTSLHYTTPHYTTLRYTTLTLHCTTLQYTTLHCTALHYTTLHHTTQPDALLLEVELGALLAGGELLHLLLAWGYGMI